MARAVGGIAGVTPLGDRPGTTTDYQAVSWKGTAAGRARMIAYGLFAGILLLNIAAENRYSGG